MQQKFLYFNIAQLAVFVMIAFISGWNPPTPETQRVVAIVVFVLMLVALATTTMLRLGKFDDRWFRCRAFAENLKSSVWFFVMSPAESLSKSEAEYLEKVEQVRERLKDVVRDIAIYEDTVELISPAMKAAQALAFEQKLALYRQHRLEDQRRWYRSKAKFNTMRERQWFAATFVIEFAALGYAGLQAWRLWEFNAVGGIAAMGAAFIAWLQTKRFSDLGTSYAIAAGDLDRIAAETTHVTKDTELQELVAEVEKAVSREHSMWLVTRIV